MKRNKIISIALLITVFCSSTSFAAPITSGDDALGSSYSLMQTDFEDSEKYTWAEKTTGTAFSGSAARVTEDVNLINDEFVGKTYFEFDFIADSIESGFSAVMGGGTENMLVFSASQIGDNIRLAVNGTEAASALKGEKVYVKLLVDTAQKTAGVSLFTNSGALYENNDIVLTASSDVISYVGFKADSGKNVFVDNISLRRESRANGEKPVITKCGGYFNAEAKTPDGGILYLVQYRGGKLVDVAMKKSVSDYTEVFISDSGETGDVYKAFVWDEELTPLAPGKMAECDDINSSSLELNGSLSASGYYSEGNTVNFNVSLPDGCGDYKITVYSGGEVFAELDNKSAWTCSKSGDYTVWLYANKDGELIPCAKTTVFVYPALTESDTFLFPAEKPYYLHNGEKLYYSEDGFVPLLYGENIYLSNDIIRRISGIEISGSSAVYKADTIVSDLSAYDNKDGVYAFNAIAAALGYSSQLQEDVLCVTKASEVDALKYDAAYDYILSHSLDGNTKAWNGLYYPDGWGFYDWSTSTYGSNFGGELNDKTDGANSVYIGAVSYKGSAYAAYTYNLAGLKLNGHLYAVSFDVKYSDDSAGNIPFAALSFNDAGGNFAGHLHGTKVEGKKGEWTRVTSYFTRESIDNYGDYGNVSLLVGAKAVDSTVAGKIYFDNVSLREVSILSESTEAEIACEKFASWHQLGENVKYIPQDDKLRGFDKIKGVVYNMDDEKVYEKTVSVREFYQNGWEYTPEKYGYYEVEFYGLGRDGTSALTVNCYTTPSNGSYTAYNLARRSFAVVDGEAKPMDERSDFLLLSDSAKNPTNLKLANMIGFSGIRIHGIAWGSPLGERGFEPTKGNFDWSNADTQINNVNNEGFKNVIANVFATPTWAVNNGESDGYTVVGWHYKNCYKADDNADIANAYGAFTERYKNKITGIEVWNEPHYGLTAFWRDTPSHFVELAKTAYDAIKAKDSDMVVYSAGFNQASALFGELMSNEDFRNAFDAVSFHGRYEEDTVYRTVLESYGMGDTPLINSEGYFYAYYQKNTPKDHRANNMQMCMAYFDHLKNNVDMAGIFEITENTLDEVRAAVGSGHTCGLFRDYPYYEPRQGAVAAYNLFKSLGKNISFEGEYDFGGGRKAVAINSDGEMKMYIWNANDEDFALPEALEECMSSSSKITDFEGNETTVTDLKKQRVYCISNIDASKLALINKSDGSALNGDYEAPYYTCRNAYGETIEDYTANEGIFTEGALFNKADFSDLDDAYYNTDGFVWNSANGGTCGIDAKFALSADDDGLYIIVQTSGDDNNSYASSAEKIPDYDGVRIGIDSYGRLRANERTELFAGYVGGVPTLYKYNAADTYQAIPDNWTPSKNVMSGDYINISSSSGSTVYKIYLPYEELYPLVYRSTYKKNLRVSIAISDTDNGVKKGDLCFGAGVTEEIPRVWKYAILKEQGHAAGIDMYSENSMLYISGTPRGGSKYISMLVKKTDGTIVNLEQLNNVGESYSKRFIVEPGVKYTVTVTDENRNTLTKTVTAK